MGWHQLRSGTVQKDSDEIHGTDNDQHNGHTILGSTLDCIAVPGYLMPSNPFRGIRTPFALLCCNVASS
jgi:hypothetical protein